MDNPQPRQWRELREGVGVTASSEDADHPIGDPLASPPAGEWRAGTPGPQAIDVAFAPPTALQEIRLVFREPQVVRTQQFTLAWRDDRGGRHEIVRQQFNFSPDGATEEIEEYAVDLQAVAALELRIVPDISGRACFARLDELRVR
jgi:hypothetical protein